jgi:hypothetical protein
MTTMVLSAFLLFSFQPMVGKMLLPLLGGAAAVWTTAVLFFQFVLLGGYFYADRLTRVKSFRIQLLTHTLVMITAVFFLPVQFDQDSLGAEGASSAGAARVAWTAQDRRYSVLRGFDDCAAAAEVVLKYR